MGNYYKGSDRVLTETEIQALLENAGGPQVGDIKWVAHNKYMDKWLLCDGSAQSKDNFPELYAAVSTLWGSSGSYGFLLPDFISRTVWGATRAGTYKEAGLPEIEGSISAKTGATGTELALFRSGTGAFSVNGTAAYAPPTGSSLTGLYQNASFSASASNSIYGNSDTVQPPAATLRPMIYTGRTNQGIMTVYNGGTVIKDGQTFNVDLRAAPAMFTVAAVYTSFSQSENNISVTYSNSDILSGMLPPGPDAVYPAEGYPTSSRTDFSFRVASAGTTDVTVSCGNGASLTFTIVAT